MKDGIGNYTFNLINNANGRFKLNGTKLLVKSKSFIF